MALNQLKKGLQLIRFSFARYCSNMEVAKAKNNPSTTGGSKALSTSNTKAPAAEITPKSISSSSLSSSNSPPIGSTSINSNSWAPPPRPGEIV